MAVIGIDFDHTIVEGDKEIPGARAAINILRENGHKVIIYSCNNLEWIVKVLANLDIRYDGITTQKPLFDLYVDDKAFRFEDWTCDTKVILERVAGLDNRKAKVLL